MAKFYILAYFFTIVLTAWNPALGKEIETINKRAPRSISKLCFKLGICGGHQGYGGHQGGHGGYQGEHAGYQEGYGHQGGYYPYPPINIGISQSQSSSSAGGGGFGSSNYPNNYQYNGAYPNYGGYNGHKRPGYFGNGFGSHNNQFNGNFYSGNSDHGSGSGGYGFQRPFGYNDGSYQDYDGFSRSA